MCIRDSAYVDCKIVQKELQLWSGTSPAERLRIKSDGTIFTVTQGAKFGISQDPTLTTMGATSGTWQVPEVDGSVIGAEMRIGDHNTNSTAIIRLASYGSGDGGVGGGAIMFTNTRNGSNSFHSDIAAIKGARESLGKGYLRFFTANQAANAERMRITSTGRLLIGTTTANQAGSYSSVVSTGASSNNGGFQAHYNTGAYGGGSMTTINAAGGGLSFWTYTGNVGAESYNERVRIGADGEVFMGTNLGATNRSTLLSISGANQDPTGVWTQVGVYADGGQAVNKGGSIGFGGPDGSTAQQQFSAIKGAKENGTSGNYAGYMAFYTRPAGAVSGERLRITSTGNIGINCTDPDSALEIRSTASSYTPVIKLSNHHSGAWAGALKFESNHNGTIYESSAIYGYGGSGSSDGILALQTRGTERLRVNAKGQTVVSPSSSMGSASGTASLSLVQTGNYGGVYPGISIKSLSTGGNGMSIFSFDSNWDLYSRSGNQTGLAFLKNTEANSANARMVIGDDGKTTVGTVSYTHLTLPTKA